MPEKRSHLTGDVVQVRNCPYRQKVSSGGAGSAGRGVKRSAVNRGSGLAAAANAAAGATTNSIMSAKLLRVKQLQNQLTDTQNQLNELVNENRLLRTLQKRQAVALQRFEGSQDQLPHLIKSHNEEIRVLTSKIKQLKDKCSEVERRLKRREGELSQLKEHHKHLVQLSQDKHLGDRETLSNRVQQLEATQKQLNDKIQMLNRRLELEGKNYRHQLSVETNRLKETQNDLKSALGTINNLKAALEAKEKYVNCSMPKRYQRSMEHLLQGSHTSLPVPPRVSIRQTDKYSDAVEDQGDYCSDSEEESLGNKGHDRDLMKGDDELAERELEGSRGGDDGALMRRGSDESSDGLKRLPPAASLDRGHRSVRWKPGPPSTVSSHSGVLKRSVSREVGGLLQTSSSSSVHHHHHHHQQRSSRRESTRRGYAADRESSGEEGHRQLPPPPATLVPTFTTNSAAAAPSSKSLAPFSKLSWSSMRMALPESKDKVIEMLELANSVDKEEREKPELGGSSAEECKDEDEDDEEGAVEREDVPEKESTRRHSPISKTRKKRILQEIFNS